MNQRSEKLQMQSQPLSLILLITMLPPEGDDTPQLTSIDQTNTFYQLGLLQDCPLKKVSRVSWRVVVFNCKLPHVLGL